MSGSTFNKPRVHFLWVTDPWTTLDHPVDTTLRLVEESQSEGFANSWCDFRSIRWESDATIVDSCEMEVIDRHRAASSFRLGPETPVKLDAFTHIMYRPDPPVDLTYLHPLQLLVLGIEVLRQPNREEGNLPVIINSPGVLFSTTEKTAAALFSTQMAKSIISSQWDALLRFGLSERVTVLKPLHKAQADGVELLGWENSNDIDRARILIGEASQGFRQPVVLQRYLEAVRTGETRFWFLEGDLLAAARKIPSTDDFRLAFDGRSKLVSWELTPDERTMVSTIAPRIARYGIKLAAVDAIDGQITDFNITSPGLLVEFERTLSRNLSREIILRLSGCDGQ
jgi:glutathione synthase